ncbi:MAG TPA: lamin tail domain-containing protein, partial [Methylomirabilota bacterium]|nr:lamin tail domain-containing protein [Methylomirabilota bacterium]
LPADGAGHSLTLTRPSYGENDSRAWSASDVIGGSPARAESIGPEPLRNLVINEFLARTVLPAEDFIELYNHGTTPLNITGCWLSDSPSTNKFRITNNIVIAPRGFAVFHESALGFGLSSSGERIYLVNSNQTRVLDAWSFEAQADHISTGRHPDGAEDVQELAALTPGTTNAPPLRHDIVINEIMYNPISGDDDDEFIELYNRGTSTVNLGGWRFEDGVDFTFPTNASLAPGQYVVAARSRNRMLANYSNLNSTNLFGNYDGSLANGGERLALAMPSPLVSTDGGPPVTNLLYVVVDEVSYGEGRWGIWADGGGSSLELIDANSDNRHAANWTDSDETEKSDWTSVSHQELMDHVYPRAGAGDQLNEVQIMLMGAGEALVDDVVVSTNLGGASFVANGDFSGGLSGWLIQGNHVRSSLEPAGSNNPTASLHLRASGAGDNGANRVEKDLTGTLPPNVQGALRASVRWLKGHPNLLFRLHGGGLEKVVPLLVPNDLGSPGARNSRAASNAGPVINAISHFPVLPAAGAPVTVSAAISDPHGVVQVVVRYRNDTSSPGVNADVPMNDAGSNGDLVAGDGVYSGIIPGQNAGTLIAFHVRATDGFSPGATSVYPAISERHEALVRFGDTMPPGALGVYRLWMTASNITLWGSREKLSNEALDGTFVYGNRVIYGMSARYRGSPFIRPGYNTPIGNACAYVWNFPSDELFLGQDETNLDSLEPSGRDSTALREITSFTFAKHVGLPFSRQRFVHVVLNGVANANRNIPIYTDSQQPDGGYMSMWFPDNDDGDIYKIDDWFEFDDTPAMQMNKSASLQNFTTVGGVKKQARYRWSWEKKFNGGYTDDYSSLYSAVNALNAPDPIYVSQVEGTFDTESWMTVLAMGHVVGDWDRYGYNRGKNTFAYRPVAGKFAMILWDLDFAIGCTGGHGPAQDLFSVAGGGDTGSDHMPEVSRMYTHPHFRRIYLRALHRIANGPLQDSVFMPTLDARYRALQANGVVSVSPYVGSGAQGISIPAWIQQRRAYILTGSGQIPSATFGLTSTSITVSSNLALISGTAPVNIQTIEFNGVVWPITWTSTTAWTAQVPVGPGTTNFVVLGRDVEGA